MKAIVFSKVRYSTILLFIAAACLSASAYSQVSQQERDALITLYNSTNGSGWVNDTGWLGDPGTECSWYGITCFQNTAILEIVLINNGLSGTIPPELGSLTNLEIIYLGGINLTGSIPPELGNLSHLEVLSISGTELTGPIPPELGNLTNLVSLSLTSNKLTGPIPPELGNLPKLDELRLWGNNLTGPIPPELGNLAGSQEFYILSLNDNQLTGSIPPELGNLTFLEHFNLTNNQLSGPIPPELGNLFRLWNLDLGTNNLTGTIPQELGNLSRLGVLTLNDNQLTGSIPPELGSLLLVRLNLSNNQLTGTVPYSILSRENLDLNLEGNPSLVWPSISLLESEALVALYNVTNGDSWFNNSNWLGPVGSECSWFGITCDDNGESIVSINLMSNGLNGIIPTELGNLSSLQTLYLNDNQLTGSVPQPLLDNVALYLYLEGNEGLTWWDGWPSPYNGVTPDPALRLKFNNIGIFHQDDQLIYACIKVLSDGLQSSIDGVEQWGIAFETDLLDESIIKINKARQFNKGNALNEYEEEPDCSGEFETTSNIYTDFVEIGSEAYRMSYELIDSANLEFRLVERNLLPSIEGHASFNGGVLHVPFVVVGEQVYQVDLTLLVGTDPPEFTLTEAIELFGVSSEEGDNWFFAPFLQIFRILVGDDYYGAGFFLIGDNPITFQLDYAELD